MGKNEFALWERRGEERKERGEERRGGERRGGEEERGEGERRGRGGEERKGEEGEEGRGGKGRKGGEGQREGGDTHLNVFFIFQQGSFHYVPQRESLRLHIKSVSCDLGYSFPVTVLHRFISHQFQ